MKCPSCSFENQEGVKFCGNCGNPLSAPVQPPAASTAGVACPSCRQVNPNGINFCMNCGTSLHAPTVNPARRKRRGCLVLAFGFLVLIVLCGASFWATLLRIPILARTDSAPQIVKNAARYTNVIQRNLKTPEKIVQFADQLYGADTKQQDLIVVQPGRNPDPRPVAGGTNENVADVPPPGFTPPETCAPNLELAVANVSQVQPWGGGFSGMWGDGPTLYEIHNSGESLENSAYEYYAYWSGHQGDGLFGIVYACSIAGDSLFCNGPDQSDYDTAEMTIYSENPNCPAPVARFGFVGLTPMPVEEDKTEACSPVGSFSLSNFVPWRDGVARETILWEFNIHLENYTLGQIDYQYYLVAEGFDAATGEWKTSQNSCYVNIYGKLACWGWDKEKYPSIHYALYQLPEDICTDPVDFGSMGSISVASEPDPQCQFNQPVKLEMVGRSDQNLVDEGEGYNYFATSATDVFDPNDSFYALYDVRDGNGNFAQQGQRGECSLNWAVDVQRAGGWYGFSCQGPTVSDHQQVSMQLFYSTGGCNQQVTERTWPGFAAGPAPTASTSDRCEVFKGIDIQPQIQSWILGSPAKLYFDIPGGVPGLEKTISNDNAPWTYTVHVGNSTSTDCQFFPDYAEKLWCSIDLPNSYSNSVNPLELTVNGCEQPIATLTTYLVQDRSGGGDGCPAGQTYHPPNTYWPGGCCSNGHWYKWGDDKEPGCWN